jgi:hypothetical protein
MKQDQIMSVRCAREKERFSCRPGGARRSKLTGNGDERRRCLWGSGSSCEQPSGGFARVLGGKCVQERGDLIGARGEAKTKQNRRIDHVRLSWSRFGPLQNLGKKG